MTLLSRSELVARLGRFASAQRRSKRLVVLVSAVGLLVLLLSLLLRAGLMPLAIAAGVWYLAILVIGLSSPGERPKRYGLVCPLCNKTLGERGAQIAIGTGRCMACGQIILTEDALGTLNAETLSTKLRAFARRSSALFIVAFVISFVLPLVLLLLINPPAHSGPRNLILFFWLPATFGAVAVANTLERRRARVAGLVCNRCGEPLTRMPPEIIAASGRCGRCGHPVSVAA